MGNMVDLAKALDKAIGANSVKQEVTEFVSFGYELLNQIVTGKYDGGAPIGRLIEIFGPPSSGKTALATALLIETQRQGGIAGFMDMERSFDVGLAESMGLDTSPGKWIYKRPKTWEEANMTMCKAAEVIRGADVIEKNAPILFVFDSIAASIPKSVVEKGVDEYNMNDTTALSRVASTTLKSVAQFADEYNFGVVYLNQIRTKPGVMFGDPTTTPGGVAMEFYASARLALSRTILRNANKDFVGQEIGIKAVKTKMTRPFQQIKLRMMFTEAGHGYFDKEFSLMEHLIEIGKLPYSQPYVTWDGKKYNKGPFADYIRSTPGEYQKLVALLPELEEDPAKATSQTQK